MRNSFKSILIAAVFGCGGTAPAITSSTAVEHAEVEGEEPEEAPAEEAPAEEVPARPPECTGTSEWQDGCMWGHRCLDGMCEEAGCHLASPGGRLGERRCQDGHFCRYESSVAASWGIGYCDPEPSTSAPEIHVSSRPMGCQGLNHCPWGFSCPHLDGMCVEAECHPASTDGQLPQRQCPDGQVCSYEDSMAVNWGAGYCDSP